MREFTSGLRFFIPVEVVSGRDRGNIVLAACGRQIALPADALEEAGEFMDAVADPETAEPVVAKNPEYVERPTFTRHQDAESGVVSITLVFVVKAEDAEAERFESSVELAGDQTDEKVTHAQRELVERGRAWLAAHGYTLA